MLSVNVPRGTTLERMNFDAEADVPERAVWLDLYSPTHAEDKLVERALGIAVPTREEMQEIEVTSRLYVENGARYMTATLMCNSDTDVPRTTDPTAHTTTQATHRTATGPQPATHIPDAAPQPRSVPDQRQLVVRHGAIGIAALAAAVRYQGTR